ncbi:hypothetical protein [Candidatus Hodarchaeum mangrovi]
MVELSVKKRVIEYVLSKIEAKNQEWGRFLVKDSFDTLDLHITFWAVQESARDLKEVALTPMVEQPELELKLTYAPPSFFLEVLDGRNTPYWQVATVYRVLNNSEIIYDPKGRLKEWVNRINQIKWTPDVIQLKQQTTLSLLQRMEKFIKEDMLADAYIWLIKAAEEAICVPLMKQNSFGLGSAPLLLDTLRDHHNDIFLFFKSLLRIEMFSIEKLQESRRELEKLADRLYLDNIKTDREMWILAAFVALNESEKRLTQSIAAKEYDINLSTRLFETSIGELWQAYFLVAQNPRTEVKLDPWVVGSFWKWFGYPEINEEWFHQKVSIIKDLIK